MEFKKTEWARKINHFRWGIAGTLEIGKTSQSREVAKGGAGGAAVPPIFWRVQGNSDVITTMTSLSLKDSPMNVYSLATSLSQRVYFWLRSEEDAMRTASLRAFK